MLAILRRMDKEETEQAKDEFCEGWPTEASSCIECINNIPARYFDWPWVNAGGLVHTNTFCMTKYGEKPLSAEVIEPFKMDE
jgi:hypothetical protein